MANPANMPAPPPRRPNQPTKPKVGRTYQVGGRKLAVLDVCGSLVRVKFEGGGEGTVHSDLLRQIN